MAEIEGKEEAGKVATKPLKAFVVTEEDEGTGGIVFATHSIIALRNGACEFGDGEIDYYKARRAPWADQYAPGPVPPLAMIDAGWFMHCAFCETRIDRDCLAYHLNDKERPLYPVEVGQDIYCSGRCLTLRRNERIARSAAERAAIASMEAELLAKIPGVTLSGKPHAYVTRDESGRFVPRQVIIGFRFPGCTIGDGHYRYEKDQRPDDAKPHVTICSGDLPAWKAWREAIALPTPESTP